MNTTERRVFILFCVFILLMGYGGYRLLSKLPEFIRGDKSGVAYDHPDYIAQLQDPDNTPVPDPEKEEKRSQKHQALNELMNQYVYYVYYPSDVAEPQRFSLPEQYEVADKSAEIFQNAMGFSPKRYNNYLALSHNQYLGIWYVTWLPKDQAWPVDTAGQTEPFDTYFCHLYEDMTIQSIGVKHYLGDGFSEYSRKHGTIPQIIEKRNRFGDSSLTESEWKALGEYEQLGALETLDEEAAKQEDHHTQKVLDFLERQGLEADETTITVNFWDIDDDWGNNVRVMLRDGREMEFKVSLLSDSIAEVIFERPEDQ